MIPQEHLQECRPDGHWPTPPDLSQDFAGTFTGAFAGAFSGVLPRWPKPQICPVSRFAGAIAATFAHLLEHSQEHLQKCRPDGHWPTPPRFVPRFCRHICKNICRIICSPASVGRIAGAIADTFAGTFSGPFARWICEVPPRWPNLQICPVPAFRGSFAGVSPRWPNPQLVQSFQPLVTHLLEQHKFT